MAIGDEIKQDRSADRAELGSLVDAFLRQGGQVTRLDWAGNVVDGPAPEPKPVRAYGRLYGDAPPPKHPDCIVHADPITPEQDGKFAAFVAEVLADKPVPRVKPTTPPLVAIKSVPVDVAAELRRIRREAKRLLAGLNAAALRAA